MRIGFGEDAHRLEVGRELWIGGLQVEGPRGAVAHSDGDVLLHGLSDALLSAFALGDIGMLFPDYDPKWKGLESRMILDLVLKKVRENGYYLRQISSVITLDRPKLGPYRGALQQHLGELVGLPKDRIGLTFKTSEGLAPDHIQARVMVYLEEM